MPPRKAQQIVEVLRSEILSGQRAPGARLPTYDAFIEQFGVTRPTVARGLKALRSEGLVTVNGTRGLFVAKTFPHRNRYLWVTSEQPGSPQWTGLLATIFDLVNRGETGIPGEVTPLVGVDGRANNPAYRTLCDAVERGSAAGLLLMSSATAQLLPVLQAPGLPRVAISAPLPHARLLSLDAAALIERACERLLKKGRRIAVFSPEARDLERAQESLLRRGLAQKLLTAVHVGPIGCDTITRLLFERPDRPDAVFVTDDSLVPPLLAGLARAHVLPRRDVYVLAHCNWPRPIGAAQGVDHIGFDMREVLWAAKQSIDCINTEPSGEEPGDTVVPARFATEFPLSQPAPFAPDPSFVSPNPSPWLSSAA